MGGGPGDNVREYGFAIVATITKLERLPGAGNEGRVGDNNIETLLPERLVEIALDKCRVADAIELGIEAREAQGARINVDAGYLACITTGNQRLDTGPGAEIQECIDRIPGRSVHQAVAIEANIHHRFFFEAVFRQ